MNDYEVEIIFTDDLGETFKGLNWKVPEDKRPEAAHLYDDKGISWMVFKVDCHPETLAHESWHCARRILTYLGAELENEVVAYLIQFLVGQSYDFQMQLLEDLAQGERKAA